MSTARRIAFVSPRFAEGGTVGGAETLLKNLAERAAGAGRQVTLLTTCATDHFTWQNVLPPGEKQHLPNMTVKFFPVKEERDLEAFLHVQNLICRGAPYTSADEQTWLANSVTSPALCEHLAAEENRYDKIVIGPYLFGLTYFASRVKPAQTLLIPCLHDESFARLRAFKGMFQAVHGLIFNSAPERDLAFRLYDLKPKNTHVAGMGLDDFEVDSTAFARRTGLTAPYLIYSGRREAGKGIPLLLEYLALFRARTGLDIKLVLTGTGAIEPPTALRQHILDLGFVSERAKQEAMAGALAFCLPSTNESFSIVLLEAWLAGVPALVHASCAVTVEHCRRSGGGLWFMTYAEFETELLLLWQRPGLRAQMGAAGRRYVQKKYAWEHILTKFLTAVDQD